MRPLARGCAALALAFAATVGATPAGAEIAQRGNLRVSFEGELSPKRLPRKGVAPIAVSVGGRIATTDGSLPPQLRTLRVELNRHGRLETRGLPICPAARIHPGSTKRALKECRAALVGRGSFTVDVALGGQEPYRTTGRLLLFNARRGGRPALLGHIYSARPFTSSFLVPFSISKRRGRYGTALTASLPQALGEWGHVRGLQLRLGRTYRAGGRRRSFISAGCPAPRGFPGALFSLARTSFGFAGGGKLSSTLTRSCRVR